MSRELDKLWKKHEQTLAAVDDVVAKWEQIDARLGQVGAEYGRVAQIYSAPEVIIEDVDRQFKQATKLNGTDITFLFLATALQCARQYLLRNDMLRISATQGDELMEKTVGRVVEQVKPEWKDVLFQSVPYDATRTGAHVSDTGLSGKTHRYRTLGHDPVLGWIFGTANIMTNSLTRHDLTTYQVSNMTLIRRYPLGTPAMLERFSEYAAQDKRLLTAAIARQAIHFGSDYFTNQGLPVPVIATVDNDLVKDMILKGHIDMYSITRGAALSALINALIGMVHRLFYNEGRDGSRQLYEVRTRRILMTSNIMATGSNVLVTALTKDLNLLDVGGMLVTLHRIVSDTRYIHEIKRDFLKNELADRIRGSEYDFMMEG